MNKSVFLLGFTLLIGPLFLLVPDYIGNSTLYDFFLLSDQLLTAQTWLYFMCEHLIIIIISYLLASSNTKHYKVFVVYFWLQVVDFIDYLLTYNSVWFTIEHLPVSMNTVGLCIFVYYAWVYGGAGRD